MRLWARTALRSRSFLPQSAALFPPAALFPGFFSGLRCWLGVSGLGFGGFPATGQLQNQSVFSVFPRSNMGRNQGIVLTEHDFKKAALQVEFDLPCSDLRVFEYFAGQFCSDLRKKTEIPSADGGPICFGLAPSASKIRHVRFPLTEKRRFVILVSELPLTAASHQGRAKPAVMQAASRSPNRVLSLLIPLKPPL